MCSVAKGNEKISGVYMLQSTRRQSVSVSMLPDQVDTCNEELETHLSTMLQSVCGTKQFWFLREWTAMSDSGVWLPYSLPHFQLCWVWVPWYHRVPYESEWCSSAITQGSFVWRTQFLSLEFSLKFRALSKVIVKGQALGIVDHYYWKKSTKTGDHLIIMPWCGLEMPQ